MSAHSVPKITIPRSGRTRDTERHPPLSHNCSVLLDVMRFGAALAVFFGHLGETRFSIGLPQLATAAHLAVAVFFVLSGFVIRYVTLQRETAAREYLIDRASRIYSVVVPALALTIFCELAALSTRPAYYALVRAPFLWRDVPFQMVLNLAFQSQNWGYMVGPLSNLPFWSLSFECFYYAIYGLSFYGIRGSKYWILLLLVVGGPSIALMFPVWLMGCWSYDLYRHFHARKNGFRTASIFCAALLLFTVAIRGNLLKFLALTSEVNRTAWLSRTLLHVPFHTVFFFHGSVPWLVQATPTYFVVGGATAAFIVWAALAFDHFGSDLPDNIARTIRAVADSTFALYLLHLPLLILVAAILGRQMHRIAAIAAAGAIIFTCIWLGRVFDTLKRRMRNWMRQMQSA